MRCRDGVLWRVTIAIALVPALTVAGCSAATPKPTAGTSGGAIVASAPSAAPTVTPAQAPPGGLARLNGRWQVSFKLTSVDSAAMRRAADQPSATWECTVTGSSMTLASGPHTYSGTLTATGPEGAGAWVYTARATYVDERGELWTSDIVVNGLMTTTDTFTAHQSGTISSKHGGRLYTATWTARAVRSR
jgi:hypothetical protein